MLFKKMLPVFCLALLVNGCQFFNRDEVNFDCQFPPQTTEPTGWSAELITLPPIQSTQYSLFFLDEKAGFILDPIENSIWKTTTGGNSWIKLADLKLLPGTPKSTFPCLFFFDSQNGLVVQDSVDCPAGCTGLFRFFKISDGNLDPLSATGWSPGFVQSLHFLNEMEGFANISTFNPLVNSYIPVLKKTVDGGENWSVVADVETSGSFMQWLPDGKTGFVSGLADRIYKTTDGGKTWGFTSPGLPGLTDFIWTDAKTGFAVHRNGIVATTDGGDIWTHVGERSMKLICADSAAVLGAANPSCTNLSGGFDEPDNRFFYSNDHGKNWAMSRLPSTGQMFPLQKLKPGLAIARGNYGPYLIRRK